MSYLIKVRNLTHLCELVQAQDNYVFYQLCTVAGDEEYITILKHCVLKIEDTDSLHSYMESDLFAANISALKRKCENVKSKVK